MYSNIISKNVNSLVWKYNSIGHSTISPVQGPRSIPKMLHYRFEAESDNSEPRIYGDVRRLYRSCMDTERIEKESLGKLVELVDRLGGWPVVEGDQWTCAPLRDRRHQEHQLRPGRQPCQGCVLTNI